MSGAAALPAADLPRDAAVSIRDTVDGGPVPNLSWAVVESMTHKWTTKQLGEGGFGEVFKGIALRPHFKCVEHYVVTNATSVSCAWLYLPIVETLTFPIHWPPLSVILP